MLLQLTSTFEISETLPSKYFIDSSIISSTFSTFYLVELTATKWLV